MHNRDNARTVSVAHAARDLGIGTSTAYKAINDGTFPVPVVRIGRAVRVVSAPLEALLAGGTVTTTPEVAA